MKRVWIIRPAYAMNHDPVEVGPEDDLGELVERAMNASPTSEVLISQEMRQDPAPNSRPTRGQFWSVS